MVKRKGLAREEGGDGTGQGECEIHHILRPESYFYHCPHPLPSNIKYWYKLGLILMQCIPMQGNALPFPSATGYHNLVFFVYR